MTGIRTVHSGDIYLQNLKLVLKKKTDYSKRVRMKKTLNNMYLKFFSDNFRNERRILKK